MESGTTSRIRVRQRPSERKYSATREVLRRNQGNVISMVRAIEATRKIPAVPVQRTDILNDNVRPGVSSASAVPAQWGTESAPEVPLESVNTNRSCVSRTVKLGEEPSSCGESHRPATSSGYAYHSENPMGTAEARVHQQSCRDSEVFSREGMQKESIVHTHEVADIHRACRGRCDSTQGTAEDHGDPSRRATIRCTTTRGRARDRPGDAEEHLRSLPAKKIGQLQVANTRLAYRSVEASIRIRNNDEHRGIAGSNSDPVNRVSNEPKTPKYQIDRQIARAM